MHKVNATSPLQSSPGRGTRTKEFRPRGGRIDVTAQGSPPRKGERLACGIIYIGIPRLWRWGNLWRNLRTRGNLSPLPCKRSLYVLLLWSELPKVHANLNTFTLHVYNSLFSPWPGFLLSFHFFTFILKCYPNFILYSFLLNYCFFQSPLRFFLFSFLIGFYHFSFQILFYVFPYSSYFIFSLLL